MWYLQRSAVRKTQRVWCELVIVSLLGHLVCVSVCSLYVTDLNLLSLFRKKERMCDTPVLFANMAPLVPKENSMVALSNMSAMVVPQPQPQETNVSCDTQAPGCSIQTVIPEKPIVKKAVHAENKKKAPKKVDLPAAKSATSAKKEAQPIAQKSVIKSEQKKSASAQAVVRKNNATAPSVQKNLPASVVPPVVNTADEIIHAIASQWKPPQGMRAACACSCSIVVGASGKAREVAVAQSSGVLIFDVAARTALLHASYPQQFHNKKITIRLQESA